MNNTGNCCEDKENITSVQLSLDNKTLWVTVNGVQAGISLASLSTGGGGTTPSGSPTEILLPVTSNGQTVFSQVIPENATPTALIIRGVSYSQVAGDFSVSGEDIVWNNGFELNITDTVVLKLWQL